MISKILLIYSHKSRRDDTLLTAGFNLRMLNIKK
jgi:hypothetical protein